MCLVLFDTLVCSSDELSKTRSVTLIYFYIPNANEINLQVLSITAKVELHKGSIEIIMP